MAHPRGLIRAIHGAHPAGAFAALTRPKWLSCHFVEPEEVLTYEHTNIKKPPRGWFSYVGAPERIRTSDL